MRAHSRTVPWRQLDSLDHSKAQGVYPPYTQPIPWVRSPPEWPSQRPPPTSRRSSRASKSIAEPPIACGLTPRKPNMPRRRLSLPSRTQLRRKPLKFSPLPRGPTLLRRLPLPTLTPLPSLPSLPSLPLPQQVQLMPQLPTIPPSCQG
jgi:hypothetical protein